ncbi:MAG: DUF3798 domain-containing protein [Firmicutes bacterium]|nr:DUF3798 domain-containing protein [Bacillota bacterium]
MKKSLFVILIAIMLLAASGAALAADYKIGVVTGTVSQGEDEYRGAENVAAKYGDMIVHSIYPDNFMQEQETTIAQIVQLASDRDVKVIVVSQAVPGTVAAIRQVRDMRPDVKFILGAPHEDVDLVEAVADLSLETDQYARGRTIPRLAHQMGAKKFLHYSFPRHMSMQLLAERRDIMREEADALGLEFLEVTAPDPMGDSGLPGTQQFILEDLPRQVAEHGKDIAIFATNCGMMEPLIIGALNTGAIFAEQCCPSPTHGYPAALGLAITDDISGDMNAILKAIDAAVVERGGAGRFATWAVSFNMMTVEAGVEIARAYVEDGLDLADMDAVAAIFADTAGVDVAVSRNSDDGNFYMFTIDSVIFGETEF